MLVSRLLQSDRCWPAGCWPDEAQRLLLQACLLKDDQAAVDAWNRWQELVPWDFIDFASHHLLLLLHDRLGRLGVTSPNQGRLAGVVRYYWVRTELLQRQTRDVLQLFEDAGIETMLLKGAALNATVYPRGRRTMADLDLAVRREHAEDAIELLKSAGGKTEFEDTRKIVDTTHGRAFDLPKSCQVDLHWSVFHGRNADQQAEDDLWTQVGRFKSVRTRHVFYLQPTSLCMRATMGCDTTRCPPFAGWPMLVLF